MLNLSILKASFKLIYKSALLCPDIFLFCSINFWLSWCIVWISLEIIDQVFLCVSFLHDRGATKFDTLTSGLISFCEQSNFWDCLLSEFTARKLTFSKLAPNYDTNTLHILKKWYNASKKKHIKYNIKFTVLLILSCMFVPYIQHFTLPVKWVCDFGCLRNWSNEIRLNILVLGDVSVFSFAFVIIFLFSFVFLFSSVVI